MDEAKSLVHMSISALLAAMLIGAAVGLIGLGYMMWSYFSRQDAANSRMSDYANYTAFDNTTVRGQEVIQLIESDLDVFVVIFDDNTTGPHSIDNITSVKSNPIAVGSSVTYRDFICNTIPNNGNSIVTCNTALQALRSKSSSPWTMAGGQPNSNNPGPNNLDNMSYSALTTLFTTTLEKPAVDASGNSIHSNSYAAFKSTLVYDTDHTTDVVGVILVRENASVNSY